jgi:hypothetical protein
MHEHGGGFLEKLLYEEKASSLSKERKNQVNKENLASSKRSADVA